MRICIALFAAAAFWFSAVACAGAQGISPGASGGLRVVIDTTQAAAPVSQYEYGMFIEHIGSLMYRSLWAEMLDDRKFYYPITSEAPAAPAQQGAGPRNAPLRRWQPIGPDQDVVMDTDQPFVGDQSPRIVLDPAAPHGIVQSGLALIKGKEYTGRIWLRGAPGTRIMVVLAEGDTAADRQTDSITLDSDQYKKYPLRLTARSDSDDGSIEITGTGTGDFHIGAVSLMPADNIDGFRPEVITLLKQIKSGFWRWGGNYTSGFDWYHAVGDPDKRPPDFDYAWNAMQTNDLGPDEFNTLCRLIGVEPYVSVNAGFGDAHSAAQEVEYMNGSVHTPMGAWRAKNGHLEPYNIKFWTIGNEPWGSWQLGHTDLKYFVLKHNQFAKAMRQADPSIVLIASGEMIHDDNLTGAMRAKYTGDLPAVIGSDADWTGGFLKNCWGNFDGIAEHWYAQPGRHFDVAKAKSLPPDAPGSDAYVPVEQTTLQFARYPANVVRAEAEEWQEYEQKFPAMREKNIFLSIDEYAYFGGGFGRAANLKLALAYGMLFNEMLRHTDFLTMAAHTTGVSSLDENRTSAVFSTTGLVFKLYADHFPGSIPVAVTGNSPQPAPEYPPGGDQPKTNSGSPTYPLDMVAALSPDRKYLILSVVNATDSQQTFDLGVNGAQLAGVPTLWQMTGSSLDSANRVGQEPQVQINQVQVTGDPGAITVAPISINIYRFPLGP